MKQSDYDLLLDSLNSAVDILNRHRTPDPDLVIAYDTLKQARAMVMKAVDARVIASPKAPELAAA